ncbi:MAG: Asp23/Gls24 family envelope stress response protein [Clostridia bacterium]|nr:Asp23/Gls24 family envelope stress response protein [Clostridia bacterium]
MPQKKENLPAKVDVDLQNGGTITYANEVIATIAGVAANEVEGIAGMCVSGGFSEILGRNRNITRGVKVEVGSQEAAVDLYIIVEYGQPIQKVAGEVQENVRRALESLTGLHVVRVDVHVQGVSFEKEKKANQTGIEASKNPVLAEPEKQPEPAKEAEEPAKAEAMVEEIAEKAEEAIEAAPDTESAEEAADKIADAVTEFSEEVLDEEGKLDATIEEVKAEEAAAEAEQEAPAEGYAEKTPAQQPVRPKRPGGRKRA